MKYIKKMNSHEEFENYTGSSWTTDLTVSTPILTGITSIEQLRNAVTPLNYNFRDRCYRFSFGRELTSNDIIVGFGGDLPDDIFGNIMIEEGTTPPAGLGYFEFYRDGDDYVFEFENDLVDFFVAVFDSANTQFELTNYGVGEECITGITAGNTSVEVLVDTVTYVDGAVAYPYVVDDEEHVHYSGIWAVKFHSTSEVYISFTGYPYGDDDVINFEISYDGITWETWTYEGSGSGFGFDGILIGSKDKPCLYVRGDNEYLMGSFSISAPYDSEGDFPETFPKVVLSGNIDALFSNKPRKIKKAPFMNDGNGLFNGCYLIYDASRLILPYEEMSEGCYRFMFYYCTMLMFPPELPATTLANYCYNGMFWGCENLIKAPVLPAETIPDNAYDYMFSNCTSLTEITSYATGTTYSQTEINAYHWVYGVNKDGVFYGRCQARPWEEDSNPHWFIYNNNSVPTTFTYVPIEPDCEFNDNGGAS